VPRRRLRDGRARTLGDSNWHAMTAKALAALDAAALHEPAPRASIEPARVVLTPQQIAAISAEARRLDTRAQILAATEFDRDMSAKGVLIARVDRFRTELEASLQLAIDAHLRSAGCISTAKRVHIGVRRPQTPRPNSTTNLKRWMRFVGSAASRMTRLGRCSTRPPSRASFAWAKLSRRRIIRRLDRRAESG
jgi:hypothetical protein